MQLKIVRPSGLNEKKNLEFDHATRQAVINGLLGENGKIRVTDPMARKGEEKYLHTLPHGLTLFSLEGGNPWMLNIQAAYILTTGTQVPDTTMSKPFYGTFDIKNDIVTLTPSTN